MMHNSSTHYHGYSEGNECGFTEEVFHMASGTTLHVKNIII